MEYRKYYLERLYPLQDRFLTFFNQINHGQFYLTGGTALSRFYFDHRYSEDLDFFSTKELKEFRQIGTALLYAAKKQKFSIEVETVSDSFLRIFLKDGQTSLKIDFVNEGVFHYGEFKHPPLFNHVDNERNILANKMTCVSRYEVKDIADIWVMAKRLSFSWREIMDIANQKSPIDPVEISKIIKTVPRDELKLIKWAYDVNLDQIYSELQIISEDLLLGRTNTLMDSGTGA